MKGIPYFAYGSNLDLVGMARRVPNATRGPAALLPDWKLVFRGVADVERAEGEYVPGAVWYLDPEGIENLDRYEGYPSMYGREWVTVLTETGQPQRAIVYVMTDQSHGTMMVPSGYYLSVIEDGYDAFGLDRNVLTAAVDESMGRKTPGSKLVPVGKKRMKIIPMWPEKKSDTSGMTPATRRLYDLEESKQQKRTWTDTDEQWLRDTIWDCRDAGFSEDRVLDIVAETLDNYRDEVEYGDESDEDTDWADVPAGVRVA